MKCHTFALKRDASGQKYIYQAIDEMDKHHREDSTSHANQGKIYERPGKNHLSTILICQNHFQTSLPENSKKAKSPGLSQIYPWYGFSVSEDNVCPVHNFKLYISRLNPKYDALWQCPKKSGTLLDEEPWFDTVPISRNPLGKFMKTLSTDAQLSQIYTNHCVRSTCIQSLDDADFEGHHIISVSGHLSKSTVKAYAKQTSDNKKQQMSDTLNEKIQPKNYLKCKRKLPEEIPPPEREPAENIPLNFQIDFLDLLTEQEQQELNAILNQAESTEKLPIDGQNKEKSSENAVAPAETPAPAMPLPRPVFAPITNNTFNQTVTHPQMPQMPVQPFWYFSGSSVTINYNYNSGNPQWLWCEKTAEKMLNATPVIVKKICEIYCFFPRKD